MFRRSKRDRSDRRNGAPETTAPFAEARERMVAHVAREVRDKRVLDAMRAVPRHEFVPSSMRRYAYEDSALAIGHGQTISQPLIVGLMTEAAALAGPDGGERVLEVGAGSGYQAAVLAQLADAVVAVERIEELRLAAERRLAHLGLRNVRCLAAGERLGAPGEAPFDAILVTAAAPSVAAGAGRAARGRRAARDPGRGSRGAGAADRDEARRTGAAALARWLPLRPADRQRGLPGARLGVGKSTYLPPWRRARRSPVPYTVAARPPPCPGSAADPQTRRKDA